MQVWGRRGRVAANAALRINGRGKESYYQVQDREIMKT
jgi:hypothetical protein